VAVALVAAELEEAPVEVQPAEVAQVATVPV